MDQIARTPLQLGASLRRRRKQLQRTQDQIGRQVHLRQGTVSHLESGDAGTKLGTLFDVLSALDLEIVIRPRTDPVKIEDIF